MISIIVPVYNDRPGLETTIESLLDQTAEEYEVIIADNGSTDGTIEIAQEFECNHRVTLVVEDEIQSSYAARNAGIEASSGEILCFIDADMWVESDWVDSVKNYLVNSDADYVGCGVSIVSDQETIFAQYNRKSGFRIESYVKNHHFAPTCCLIVHRKVIEDVGAFDSRLVSSGDYEFGRRVHRAGYQQRYAEHLQLYHPARKSLFDLISKNYRIGRGWYQRARLHPDLCEGRHPLNPINFLPDPLWIIRVNSQETPVSRIFVYFVISYILRLSKAMGQITEWRRHSTEIS